MHFLEIHPRAELRHCARFGLEPTRPVLGSILDLRNAQAMSLLARYHVHSSLAAAPQHRRRDCRDYWTAATATTTATLYAALRRIHLKSQRHHTSEAHHLSHSSFSPCGYPRPYHSHCLVSPIILTVGSRRRCHGTWSNLGLTHSTGAPPVQRHSLRARYRFQYDYYHYYNLEGPAKSLTNMANRLRHKKEKRTKQEQEEEEEEGREEKDDPVVQQRQ